MKTKNQKIGTQKTSNNLDRAILQILAVHERPMSKREIARHLHLKGTTARIDLKRILADLISKGQILHQRHLYLLPSSTAQPLARGQIFPITITHIDEDGRVMGQALKHELPLHLQSKRFHRHLVPGMQVLGRIIGSGNGAGTAEIIRLLEKPTRTQIGLFVKQARGGSGGIIIPCERQRRHGPDDGSRRVPPHEADKLADGDVVVYTAAQGASQGSRAGGTIKIIERLSSKDDSRLFSSMSIHAHDLPAIFPSGALDEAAAGTVPPLGTRTDLRHIDFVTIDGEDARDFDDAVWATLDDDPKNPQGWRLWVAIADVAHYVKPGSELDHEAYRRGNSVYFPDLVVPMLPEDLSNELCSLKPDVDRACMAVEMVITSQGKMRHSRFYRGLMRSRARLTYGQVQDAIDGKPDPLTAPLLPSIIQPLYAAFRCLEQMREHRGTLELNVAELQIIFDDKGRVASIAPRLRLDSHRLIEEFMIAANVAAAHTLSIKDYPCLYRIHDTPDHIRVANLTNLLKKMAHTFAKTIAPTPHHFNELLKQTSATPHERLIHDLVLRTQAQARYNPVNIGHYGLGLKHYCHFTSPIRRYADLIVHRALIEALALGDDGGDKPVLKQHAQLTRIGDHISETERTAATAEREVFKRFAATSLQSAINKTLPAVIVGVTASGVFVEINATGADGFIPKAAFPGHLLFDPLRHCFYSRKGQQTFQLGQRINVMIIDVNPLIPEIRLRLVL